MTCRGRQRPDRQSLGVLNVEVILGPKSNEELLKAFHRTHLGLRFGYWANSLGELESALKERTWS